MQISQTTHNKKYYTIDDFINIIQLLIDNKAENINFVTPDHFMPHILEAVTYFKEKKINIPFVYNCSGYETVEHLKIVNDYIDIYLIDYKFADKDAAKYCLNNEDYPDTAEKAIGYVIKNKGNLVLDDRGKALKGVLIRHLVMPHFIENSIKVINNLYFDYGSEVYLSLMSQYSPFFLKDKSSLINRRLLKDEYEQVINLVNELNFKNGFIQDFIDTDDEYLPDFNEKNIFEAEK